MSKIRFKKLLYNDDCILDTTDNRVYFYFEDEFDEYLKIIDSNPNYEISLNKERTNILNWNQGVPIRSVEYNTDISLFYTDAGFLYKKEITNITTSDKLCINFYETGCVKSESTIDSNDNIISYTEYDYNNGLVKYASVYKDNIRLDIKGKNGIYIVNKLSGNHIIDTQIPVSYNIDNTKNLYNYYKLLSDFKFINNKVDIIQKDKFIEFFYCSDFTDNKIYLNLGNYISNYLKLDVSHKYIAPYPSSFVTMINHIDYHLDNYKINNSNLIVMIYVNLKDILFYTLNNTESTGLLKFVDKCYNEFYKNASFFINWSLSKHIHPIIILESDKISDEIHNLIAELKCNYTKNIIYIPPLQFIIDSNEECEKYVHNYILDFINVNKIL